jgi:RHS repeat-associated protein
MTRQFRCLVLRMFLTFITFAQIASAQVPTGTPPFGSYAGSPDIVNLGNLNAHWDVPIFAKPGRGGFNFTYDLVYDSSVWYQDTSTGTVMWKPVANWGWAGQTQVATGYVTYTTTTQPWCLFAGQYYGQQWNYSWAYVDAFGVQHSFPGTTYTQNGAPAHCNPSSNSLTSTAFDGSGWTISITSGNAVQYVQSRSATVMQPPVQSSTGPGSATDKNGNQITVNSSGQFFDTTSSASAALTVSGTNPLTFAYTAPSGTAQFKVIYTAQTVQTNFQCPNIQDYPATSNNLVGEIDLPEYNASTNPNARYTFTYEPTPGISGVVTGRLQTVTLPTGGAVTYAYTGGSNGIMCADGSTAGMTRAVYDGTNTNTWTYTRSGSVPLTTTNITDPQGNLTSIEFSGIYETQRVVNQLVSGTQTVLQTVTTCYNGATSGCAGASVGASISQRNVTNQLGSGGPQSLTVFMYNGAGLITEEDDYDFSSGTTLLEKTFTTYVQYSNGNIVPQFVTVCTPGGSPPSSYCNNSGSIAAQTSYGYDATAPTPTSGTPQHVSVGTAIGNLTGITTYTGPTTYLSKMVTYFDTGNVQTITDVNNFQTTFSYGACGNSYATNVSEPLGLSRSMNWNCTGGVETSVSDENNQNITTSYTNAYYWRPASVTDQINAVTSYCYGLLSGSTCSLNPNQVETVLSINSNSAVDSLTTTDGLGRVHLQQKRQAPGSTNFDTVETDYDPLGRATRVTVPYIAGAGQTNSSAAATVTSYDPLSRPTQITDAGNGSVSYSYPQHDILLTVGPAPSGENTKKRQLEYDALGRVVSVCEITGVTGSGACGQASSQVGFWTTYIYDTLSNLKTVTQNAQATSGQQTRNFNYDFLSRLTSESNPESGTTSYSYDTDATCGTSNGDRVKRVDAVGNTTCFTYDALHRTTSATYSGPYASSTPNKYFVYDTATVNGVSMTLAKTRLADAYTATSQTGSKITDEGFSYTGRGELSDLYESTPHSGGYYHLNQTYWAHGMPSQLSGNIGLPTIQYGGTIGSTVGLDGEGRVAFVTASLGLNPVTGVTFNSASLPTQVNFGSGDTDIISYDPTLRTNQFQSNIGGKTNIGTLTWNANSTLQQLTISDPFNGANSQTCNYVHDDLMRVTSANCGSAASQTFSYNADGSGAFGNLSKSGSPYSFQPTYSASTNQMTTLGSVTPTYDNNGNLTNDGNHSYAWDADGNSITIDGVGLTFDALDRAVEKNNGGTYMEFAYSATGAKLALMSGTTLQKAFVSLPGQAQAVYTSSGLSYYRHSDWLGSYRLSSTAATSAGTPGTGTVTLTGPPAGKPGTGSVTFSGTLQSKPLTQATGTVTITSWKTDGSDESRTICTNRCMTFWNSGTITITVNGFPNSLSYYQGSHVNALAATLTSGINGNANINSIVSASVQNSSASKSIITITARQAGSQISYSLTTSSTWNGNYFSHSSFPAGNSGSISGGTNLYDSGTCTTTVNSHPDPKSWSGSGTTASSIASALYGVINGDSGAAVSASSLSGSTFNLTANSAGSTTNYPLSASCTYDSSNFSSGSFSASTSGSTLTGGYDAGTASDSGSVWVVLNGTQYLAPYSPGTTTSSLINALVAAINGSGIVTTQVSGSTITLTSIATGSSANYSLSSGSSGASFTISNSGMTGGTDSVTTTVYADTAYAPFGEPYAQAGASDLSFTGQNQDTVGGVYDFPAREYSIQGRWPSPDPAGLAAVDPTNPQSWNRYAYVYNSPLNLLDPTGLCGDAFQQTTTNGVLQVGPAADFPCPSLQPWLTITDFACIYFGTCRSGGGGSPSTGGSSGGAGNSLTGRNLAHTACVAGYTGAGAIAGGSVGGPIGTGVGAVVGGSVGTLAAPGPGTAGGVLLGGSGGGTIGTVLGTAVGGGLGYVVGNIVCSQSGGARGGGSNQSENAKFAEAVRRIEKAVGELRNDQVRRLHDLISGQGLTLDEIVQLGIALFR